MSMREYCVHDFGYVFSEKMIDQVIKKMKPKDLELGDTYEMAEIMGLDYVGNFTGEAIRLDDNGDDDYKDDAWTYSGDTVFYFPIGTYSSLFQAAYQSKEELAVSMRCNYQKRLPDDLNEIYDGIRHIVESSFG